MARQCAQAGAVLALALPLAAHAQLSPEVARGLGWLQAQVQPDGALAAENASIATPLQARSETLHTLKLLNAPAASLSPLQGALGADTEDNTEYMARRAGSLAFSGSPQAALVGLLQQRQNRDGGYGGAPGYASHALDTALVLRAQKEAPSFAAASVIDALAYLSAARNPDGSYGSDGVGRVYPSVQALLAGSAWSGQPGAGDITVAGQQWLLAQRGAAQDFGNAHDNALALWALTGLTTQTAILQPLVDALHAEQMADGSWNGDPYVTAIALRALFRVTQAPLPSSGAALHGTVVDAGSSAALAAVTVQVVGGAGVTVSDSRGQFGFASLAAGTHTLRFSRAGYASRDVALTLAPGQSVNVGNVALAPASLTASLAGVLRNQAGAVLANATVSVGTATALTDAQGNYKLADLSPGSATITVSLAGYQPLSATVDLAAGVSYLFSPRLTVTNGTPPSVTSIAGAVIDAVTRQGIVGVSVKSGNLNATSGAAGAFTLTPAATGPFSITLSAAGYQGVVVSGMAVAGVNSIGSIALNKLPTTSSLSGMISDAATGAPIASASVRVEGQGQTVLSGADGKYSIGSLTGTSFTLKVGASAYLARSETVTLSQAGAALANVALQPQALGDSDISFIRVQTPLPAYPATGVIPLELVLANGASSATGVQVSALVLDASDSVVHEYLASPVIGWQGLSYGNNPVTVAANSTLALMLDWNAMRLPAGAYRIKAQAQDTTGRLLAEADALFNVQAAAALAGGVTADPPLAQAGAKTEISLTGDLMNSGNLTLPAGELNLRLILERADPAETKPGETSLRTAASGLPMATPAKLKADAAGNIHTVNPSDRKVIRIAPNGVQSVLATLPAGVTPVDLSLAPDATVVVAVQSPARLYKVGVQGELAIVNLGSSLTSLSALDIGADGTIFVTGKTAQGENRLVRRDAAGVETVLQRNGLANPYGIARDGEGNYVITNYGDGTLSRVNAANGDITPLAGGISGPRGIAYGPDGNFYVAAAGSNKVVKVTPAGVVSDVASGLNQPYDLRFDQSGTLFVSNTGDNAIVRIGAGGALAPFAKGVANTPQAMRYDSTGNLWITNNDGSLRKLDTQDQASVEATGMSSPRGLAIDANGDVLVAEYGAGRISRVSAGARTTFASGLSNPYGVAIDADGVVHVTERGANRITRFDGAGNKLGVTESKLISPSIVRGGANGDAWIQGGGLLSRIRDGVLELVVRNFNYSYWAADSAAGGLVAASSNSVLRVSEAGAVTTLRSGLPFAPTGVAMAPDGAILLLDTNNYKIHRLAADGSSIAQYAALPGYVGANQMQSDAAGNVFVRLSNSAFYRILADGAAAPVAHTVPDYIYSWAPGGNGLLAMLTYYRTYKVDALTGASSVWLADRGMYGSASLANFIGGDNRGNLVALDSGTQSATVYSGAGALLARHVGFYLPQDIVWTGSEMRFVDNGDHLLAYEGAGYPAAKAGRLPATFLTQLGADTLGSSSAAPIYRWTGTGSGYVTHATVTGATTGLAGRSDGFLAVADTNTSRVMVLDSSKAVVRDFAGLISPQGMTVDGAGRLYVANNGAGTIARFDSTSIPVATTFARVASPIALGIDGAGKVIVARQGGVSRLADNGAETVITASTLFTGVLGDGASLFAVDSVNSQLRKLQTVGAVNSWPVFAAGLSTPVALRAAPDNAVYILSRGNNTVVRYADGMLDTVASTPAGMNALELSAAGVLTVAGNAGVGMRIDPDRATRDLGIDLLVSTFAIAGLYDAPDGKLYALGTNNASPATSSLFEMSISAPSALPPAGTVVYQTSVPMEELEANGSYAHYDFGKWVAPYGGDFRLELYRDGVDGRTINFLHVGPNAQSRLTAASAEVPPGDSQLGMCLDLKGADFSSISRVEMGQVRPVSMSGVPNGMAGDRAGNLYVTNGTTLYRTSADGVSTVIANGMNLSFGLATDADQNFYVASKKASTGRYELLRINLAGEKTVVADLGVSTANGVQLNSKDEVLVGSPGKLIKVDRQGVVTVVATAGLPSPRGVAVDGRDNAYIQNENHMVSMVRPDGSTVSHYSKANGTTDPIFEGDGYPNIAADCADNFYIAPSQWSRISQYGEEHSLAQVVPSTGAVALLFDTAKIDSSLTDIDYLSFDRFSNRLLMWNHGSNRIWQVPVTCGAIGVEAHLVSHPGQVLTGASRPPGAAIARADGSTEYVWSLRDVTAQGAQVCFSAAQNGFKLGEERKAIGSGFISFQNSFAPGEVTVPLAVPDVRAANLVSVGAATDKPEYVANEYVQLTATLANTNPVAVAGDLRLDLYDAAGQQVASVLRQGVTMQAGEALKVDGAYNVGATVPGVYTAHAVLSSDGTPLAQGTVAFKVLADQAQATATSTLALDKLQYGANERVSIASRAISQSLNLALDNLTLNLRVLDPAGAQVLARTWQINQLGAGRTLDFALQHQLRNAAPGAYSVVQTLLDAEGRSYGTRTAGFSVAASSDTGDGLAGTINVSPNPVEIGASAALSFSAVNQGNSALPDLPLTVRIVDPEHQAVVAEYPYRQSIAQGASFGAATGWTAAGTPGENLVALLAADLNGKALTLASQRFTLVAAPRPPVKLAISQAMANGSRVLVLVSCNDDEHDSPGPDGKPPVCETERSRTIDEALTSLGVVHKITTSEDAFRRALRSGLYNTYWISGKEDKLHTDLPGEVREAAFSGDGLIMDGVHDERNKVFDGVAGIVYGGKTGETELPVQIGGAMFEPQRLSTVGRALRPELARGVQQAAFDGADAQGRGPAIVSNAYGSGQSVLFAFDLARSMADQDAWLPVLGATLKAVMPLQAPVVAPGSVLRFRTSIANLGAPAELDVGSALPAGAAYIDASVPGEYDAMGLRVDWRLSLGIGESAELYLSLRAPNTPGSHAVGTRVSSVFGGVATPYGDALAQVFTVASASHTALAVKSSMQQLALSQSSDRNARDRAVSQFNAAMTQFNRNTVDGYASAIASLVAVSGTLETLPADTTSARLGIDRILREAQWRWSGAPGTP